MNNPPVVSAPDSSKFFCAPDTIRFRVTATDPDAGDTITLSGSGISTPIKGVSPVYADVKFYISSSGTYNYVYQVSNHCGFIDYDTATWNITMNSPPTVSAPDGNKFICIVGDSVNFNVNATDTNTGQNLTLEKVSGPGSFTTVNGTSPLSGVQKWAPATTGTYNFIYKVTDACGATDYDTAMWVITINSAPVIVAPDSTKKLCQPDTIRFTVVASDSNTNDTLRLELVSTPGIFPTINGPSPLSGVLKYYVSTSGTYTFIFKATDKCGGVDYDTAVWNVNVNHPPVVTAPDSTKFLCTSGVIGFTITATDPDLGDTITLEGPGISTPKKGVNSISANVQFNITASGTYNYVYKVTNGCGAVDYDTATWIITINSSPTLNVPQSISACLGDTAKFTVTGDDPDKNYNITLEKVSGVGDFTNLTGKPTLSGNWSWIPSPSDTLSNPHKVVFKATDHCGFSVTDTVLVIAQNCTCGINVKIGVVSGEPCEVVEVPVEIQTCYEFGAFDFYIEFDPTILYFLGVDKGPGLPQGWEYFTYRQLPCPMCGCCKYKLQILGLADIKNLTLGETIKPNPDFITIAYLKFKIACDEDLRGTEPNICFEWDDEICTENTLSDPTGNILYVSDNPDFYGTPCPDADGISIINKVTFVLRSQGELPGTKPCGGVMIEYAGDYARGDINLNGIAYEPADLTLFSNALIYGKTYFPEATRATQLALTDINADGFVLSMTDFILMIRIILHDATPIPKPTPGSDLATIYVTQGKVSTNATLGAALFTFKGEGTVSSNLTFEQGVVDGNLRVLVYMNSGAGVTGELLTVSGATLDKVEAVDNFGRPVKTTVVNKVIPTAFALYANYPNPFNPTTNISFALPENSRANLKIYNLSGQLVKTVLDANLPAGTYTVIWDGTNSSEERVASGIYFYQLTDGNYSQTRKMCFMK
jgi:hypothetical protein